jgi:DNA-binding NarL/FixJ family response regulator
VAEAYPLLRLGLATALEPIGVKVASETTSGRDLPRLAREADAAFAIVGSVADLPVDELVRRLKALTAPPAVVVMIGSGSSRDLANLLSLDTDALVLRSIPPEELRLAVERVQRGERVVAPSLLPSLLGSVGPATDGPGAAPDPGDAALTKREREVLTLLAEGRSNRELAAAMFVTLATVKTHLAHIYTKLDASNRNEAIGRAIALGLIG